MLFTTNIAIGETSLLYLDSFIFSTIMKNFFFESKFPNMHFPHLYPFLFICLRLNSLNLFVLILTNFLRVMIMMRVIQFWKCLCSRKTTQCICSCMICIVYIVYIFGLILWWWWWEWFWSVYAADWWKEDNGVGSFSEAAGLEKLGEGAGWKGEGPAAYG